MSSKLLKLVIVLSLLFNALNIAVLANQRVVENKSAVYRYEGQPGQPGAIGDTGKQGVQGLSGIPGQKGEVGPQGIQGVQGLQGEKGADGTNGEDGEKPDYDWRCHPTQNIRQYRLKGELVWRNEANSTCRV